MTVDAFAADPEVGPATREMKHEAKALFIVPHSCGVPLVLWSRWAAC